MPTALFSVYDKTDLVDFARALAERGWALLASGGTAAALREAGLPVREVADLTGEAEILGGRVKTLHPAIHAGLLARARKEDLATLAARGWPAIDLVAVNLYPFERAAAAGADLEAVVEHIDVGGVALLRAAAKNFERVTVLCDPADYPEALDPPDPAAFRRRMALKAFACTAAYDAAIAAHLAERFGRPAPLTLHLYPALDLRYGENPHQQARLFAWEAGGTPFGARQLHGKPLSYNNLLDLDAAWDAARTFQEPCVVVVKHLSPCGVAVAESAAAAAPLAIASDPVSSFGGVVACNRPVEEALVEALGDLFLECLIAPAFEPAALERLRRRKNLRLLEAPGAEPEPYLYRSILGGLLRQTPDPGDPPEAEWRVVTRRAPSQAEMAALRFAWAACRPVHSNAIVLARAEGDRRFTVGVGGGQPSRVDAVRLAGARAGERARGAALASDGFFPFPDGVEAAAELGVTAIIQPGGSIRDEQVIRAADEAGLAMVLTGVRHFRH